jgi:DNA polymerase-3 subunit gamma/tau
VVFVLATTDPHKVLATIRSRTQHYEFHLLTAARCARALELLGHAIVEMRQAAEPRIPLEVAVIRLSQPSMDTSVEALLDRVERLEARLAGAGPVSAGATSAGPVASAEASEVAESADRPTGSPAATTRPQPPTATRVPAQERPPSAQPPSTPAAPAPGTPAPATPAPAPSTAANGDPAGPAAAPRRSNVGWRL